MKTYEADKMRVAKEVAGWNIELAARDARGRMLAEPDKKFSGAGYYAHLTDAEIDRLLAEA